MVTEPRQDVKRKGRSSSTAVALALLSVVALGFGGCSTSLFAEEQGKVEPSQPADQLYNEAIAALNKGEYTMAGEKFQELDRQHPYSELARKSLLMMAFTNYRLGKYPETVQAAKRYIAMNPTSPDAAYAQYLIAQSNYNQIPDVTRDQAATEKALAALQEIVRRYPDSEYAADAQKKIDFARDQLAGREMQIGRYYLERRNYIGGINRFKTVVEKYQNTRHVEEALYRLTEAYMALGVVNEAQTAAAILGHNYPESDWYQNAFALLKTGGTTPHEHEGTWLSRTWKKLRA